MTSDKPYRFGDVEPDDLFDDAPPDPEAVARIYAALRHRFAPDQPRRWEDLHPWERALLLYVFVELVARLRREGTLQ